MSSMLALDEDEELELFELLQLREQLNKENYWDTLFPDKGSDGASFGLQQVTRTRNDKPELIFEPINPNEETWSRCKYTKHLDFFKAGKEFRQRAFISANRVGKTLGFGFELVQHLTGQYKDWWEGFRFQKHCDWWCCGVDAQATREVLQETLLGKVGEIGTGLIPKHLLDIESLTQAKRANTPINSFRVLHTDGEYSTVTFKSYAQGRETFQGTAKSIWLDEECPQDIYAECLTRTATGNNILVMTFTPLKGPTPLIKDFLEGGSVANIEDGPVLQEDGEKSTTKYVVGCDWDDVPHLNEAIKQDLLKSYPPHMRDARSKGIPAMGSGIVLPIAQSTYVIEPFEIPKHWKKAYGFDVGRNTAAVWIAEDPETRSLYTYRDWQQVEGNPSLHVQNIQLSGKWLKGAIDTASRGRSQTDGENLFQIYTDLGLNVVNADKAVEAGLYEILELLVMGRLKIFNTCTELIRDISNYYRDEKGSIVKKNDHRIDAWRYAIHTRDQILATEVLVSNSSRFLPTHRPRL